MKNIEYIGSSVLTDTLNKRQKWATKGLNRSKGIGALKIIFLIFKVALIVETLVYFV